MIKRILLLLLAIAAGGSSVWAMFHFGGLRWQQPLQPMDVSILKSGSENARNIASWAEAVERVKEARTEASGGNIPYEVPPELRHYSDRHWFLATQVAEVSRYDVPSCQDFVDLAALIERGEMVTVPAVTDTYVLYGVGQKADDGAFSRYADEGRVDLYDETQLADAYKYFDSKMSNLRKEIAALNAQSRALTKRERTKQGELQKQITARQQELNATNEDKALLDRFYGKSDRRQKLLREYASLQALAKDFAGRSFDLNNPSDRQALRVTMLSSLRPAALKILEEVAAAYHGRFNRPLPVSSLVRPELYQRALRRVNRNAVLIDTPPHSTGLAFDIDYRYMSGGEQTFVMAELARLKLAGRIEAIRERSANYHVFAFLHGTRPSDELITDSLDEATLDKQEGNHAATQPLQVNGKKQKVSKPKQKSRRRRR
jgi:hypothetical protein